MPRRRRLLEPLFIDENRDPVQFHLHESVYADDRIELTGLIQKYGGVVIDTDEGANTVIVDRDYEVFDLQNAYYAHSQRQFQRVRVEDTTFVRACIKKRTFQHTPVVRYPMRGNYAGRVKYTKEDEEKLCRYLAIKVPDSMSGGRLGHRIYEDMVNLAKVMPDEYRWVTRHPPESWREHYRSKKNRARLDAVIQRFRNKEQPTEEQCYIYDRKLEGPKTVGRDPDIDKVPQSYDKYRDRRRSLKMRKALMEEEEESSPNEETSRAEEGTPDNSEHNRPSSLFSVDQYEEEQMEEQVDKSRPINHTPNEPLASQTTLVGPGNHEATMEQSPFRARRQHSNQQMFPTEGAVLNEPEEHIPSMNIAEPQLPIPPATPITYQGKRKRGQNTQVPTDDAPYRNTRTRSGSMGVPPLVVPPRLPRPVRKGRKKKAIEAEQNEESANQGRAEVPETSAEEAEQLLMVETNGEGSRTPNSHPQQERAWSAIRILQTMRMEAEGRRSSPLSNDEQRLRRNDVSEEAEGQGHGGGTDLNTPGGRSPQRLQWSATRILQSYTRGSEVEGVEEKPLLRRRTLETDDEQIDRELRQTKSEYDDLDPAELLREFNESKPHLSPTPVGSASGLSVESFPKQSEEKGKQEEYVPPTITRAARYARRQRG